jgi:hypothetical protein
MIKPADLVMIACVIMPGFAWGADRPDAAGVAWRRHVIDASSRGADGVRLVRTEGRLEVATGWEQGGQVRICLHPGVGEVQQKWPGVTVGTAGDVEDAVLVDLDGDGALDVVSCSEGKTRTVNVHWAPKQSTDRYNAAAWTTENVAASRDAMMWMFALPLDVDGRHGIDLVAGGKGKGAAIGWFEAPPQARDLAEWKWHELRRAGWLMSLLPSDMDGDGDLDVVYSDRKGASRGAGWLENPGVAAASRDWKDHAIGGEGKDCMFLSVADLDADGREDVLLAVQPKEILWLRRLSTNGREWEPHSIPLPEPTGIVKAVSAGDIDLDGGLDLVFSCEQAKDPAEGLMWLSADGDPRMGKWIAHRMSGVDGVKHDLVALVDLDSDGDLDAMTTEEVKNLGVIWYENPVRPLMMERG